MFIQEQYTFILKLEYSKLRIYPGEDNPPADRISAPALVRCWTVLLHYEDLVKRMRIIKIRRGGGVKGGYNMHQRFGKQVNGLAPLDP